MPDSLQAPPDPAARLKMLLLVLLCAAWILPGLTGHEPWKPDEAYSFGLVYHILASGDWVVPTLAGEAFMEKPPIYYLTAAAFARLFSGWLPLHDGARLATGFYMSLTLLGIGLAGRELLGRGNGRIAVLVLLGCLGLLLRGHEMITDMALLSGFALALYGLALAPRLGWQAGIVLGTGVGLGFMAKGVIAPGLIGVTALLLPLFPAWRTRRYLACLGVAFAVALPWLLIWPLALYARSGAPLPADLAELKGYVAGTSAFMDWLWINNFGRFFGFAGLGPGASHWDYFKILPWFAWPAWPLAAWALWQARARGLRAPRIQLPLLAFTVMFTVLSLASDAREVYALPMLLPLALLGAAGVNSLRRGAAAALDWFGVTSFTLFTALVWFGWYAMTQGAPAKFSRYLLDIQPGYTPTFQAGAFAIALVYSLLWLLAITRVQRSSRRAVVNWAAGITLFWGVFMSLWLPWLDAGKSYRAMIAELSAALPAEYDCVASVSLGEPQRALLHYYAGILSQRRETRPDATCELLLHQGSAGEPQSPGGNWREIWQGARPGDSSERYWLYQRINGRQ